MSIFLSIFIFLSLSQLLNVSVSVLFSLCLLYLSLALALSLMYIFPYRAQSYTARGSISPPTAKPGQNLLVSDDWIFAVCQGQGMKRLGYIICLYLRFAPAASHRKEVFPSK